MRSYLGSQVDALQKDAAVHQPVGIHSPGRDLAVLGLLVLTHLLHNAVVEALQLAQVSTRDVFSAPTIESGKLTSIFGADVIATANMHRANQDATYGLKANASGKVDLTTASNNTTGAILAVRWDQWRIGYKRRWKFETERNILSDSTTVVMSSRVGMVYRDTEAAAISYNLTL